MAETLSENDKRVWDYKMADLVKIERIIKRATHNLFSRRIARVILM